MNDELGNLENQLVLLKEKSMAKEYRDKKNRYFFCTSGFGCSPTSRGSAVYGFHLNDGSQVRWDRSDVDEVIEITPEYQARIDEVKAFHKRRDNYCSKCGREILEGESKVVEMFTLAVTCKDCLEKREAMQS